MVGSISSSSMVMPQQSQASNSSRSLSSSQLETISSVLEGYDADNLSSQDAQDIVQAFSDAGITPSRALESAMKTEGFDAKEVGDLAGVSGAQGSVGGPQGGGGMPPPPPPPSDEEESTVSSLLDTLLSTDEDDDSTISSTSSFDDIMEYTSRILNLNDTSKTEVMDMLDKFSSDETDYTSEEKSNIVKNSLSEILSDSDNYNRVSFYA